MPTETGIDAHHEDQVEGIDDGEYVIDMGWGIDHDTGSAAEGSDLICEVSGVLFGVDGFDMKTNRIGTVLCKWLEEHLGIGDHEVDIEVGVRACSPAGGTDGWAQREVGNEMPIHYIDMEQVRTGFDGGLALVAQIRKIRCQNRRGDQGEVDS